MRIVKNERGIALVLVMILALIGLAIVSSLMYMMTTGTRSSGAEKFYRTADEAAFGGARIATDLVLNNFDSAVAGASLIAPFAGQLGTALGNNACLTQKLSLPPGTGFANWTQCNANSRNIDAADNPDMTFQVAGVPNTYNVFTKVVDTIEGNTAGVASGGPSGGGATGGGSGGLSTGGVGGGGASIVTPPRRSWIYRIEIQAQDSVNPQERSRYTVLYAH